MADLDRYQQVLDQLDALDQLTPADAGCPHAIDLDGPSCTRASRTAIELARARSALGQLIKAATPLATGERRAVPGGGVSVASSRIALHELGEALATARQVLDR